MALLFYNSIVFLLGLAVGSFLNVVIFRLERDEALTGRSRCLHCKHQLGWRDLIPVFSFLWLGGKCRYCKKPISRQYPLVEAATAVAFLIIFAAQPPFSVAGLFQTLFFWYVAASLIVIFAYDIRHFLIPDAVLIPAILAALAYRVLVPGAGNPAEQWMWSTGNYLLAAFLASGFFFLIYAVSRGQWMGFGDVKLAVLMGLLLGFPGILAALFAAFVSGAAIGVSLMAAGRKGLKSQLPFAPFLILGTAIAPLLAPGIAAWYNAYILP